MSINRKFATRMFWNNYIDSLINSIKEDKDSIIDMLIYGRAINADVTMRLDMERNPTYEIKVEKIAKDSPFGEENDE